MHQLTVFQRQPEDVSLYDQQLSFTPDETEIALTIIKHKMKRALKERLHSEIDETVFEKIIE